MSTKLFATSLLVLTFAGLNAPRTFAQTSTLPPIDPQMVRDQQDMTWDDYRPIPGKDWADPSLKPKRGFNMALVAVDFPDQPFVITKPKHSDPFGNPQIDPIPREQVAQFYADFYNKPSAVNHGHTINGYWMEQSRGGFGITNLQAFGPYQMPTNFWYYGLNEFGQTHSGPHGIVPRGNTERDADRLWRTNTGKSSQDFDCVLRIYAGYDETGVWQEFGEMKFETRDDIPAEWGNPDTSMPRWAPTRYVPWTSWLAGAQHWGVSSIRQGENSGTITHELGHFAFGIGDNNNNPYVQPYRRVGSGPWDMMDRGSFNGPGGPHSRWVVPATQGAAMPAGLMLRNKIVNGFVRNNQLLRLNRDGLAKSGLAVATIAARAVEPSASEVAGVVVTLDGAAPRDHTPIDDPATNALSPGRPTYNNYTVEVVQRIGYDSFCPDSGVLLAKNKDREDRNNGGPNGFNCFNWVIDAHPEDINMVDFKRPKSGTPVMRTLADFRQLNDALFHAGLNSGSQYEYEDPFNRLHFYIIDVHHDGQGVLSYTVGVRSLDGAGPQTRGVALETVTPVMSTTAQADCVFQLKNTGATAATEATLHPQDESAFLNSDIYRLSVAVEGAGWTAQLRNDLAAVEFGKSSAVSVYVAHAPGAAASAVVTLTAKSESDPAKTASATCQVK